MLRIMSPTKGDVATTWDPAIEAEVQEAMERFDKAIASGALIAFKVDEQREGEPIKQFDKEAHEILLVPRMAGG